MPVQRACPATAHRAAARSAVPGCACRTCWTSPKNASPPTRSRPNSNACTRAIDAVRGEMRALRERLHGALAHEVGEFLDLHALLLDDPELLHGLDDLIRTGRYTADYALRLQRDRIAAVFDGDGRCRTCAAASTTSTRSSAASTPRCIAATTDVAGRRRRHPGHRQRRAGRTRAAAGAGRDGDRHRRRQRAVAQRDPRAQPAPAAGGRRARRRCCKINDGDVLVVDGAQRPGRRRTRRRRPARATARACATRRASASSSTACAASPRARSTASTSSCTPTPNRARTSPRRMRCGAAGVGPVPHRIPVPAAQRTARRGRTVPRLSRRRARHDRPHGHDPHARPRRRQGRPHRPGAATTNPIPRSACAACACRWRATALFATQLRAILRASGYGPVRVLVPMVSMRARKSSRCARAADASARATCAAKATRSPTTSRSAR